MNYLHFVTILDHIFTFQEIFGKKSGKESGKKSGKIPQELVVKKVQ